MKQVSLMSDSDVHCNGKDIHHTLCRQKQLLRNTETTTTIKLTTIKLFVTSYIRNKQMIGILEY